MQYIVDRIEEELVVCEDQSNGEMLAMPRSLFAQALREGDGFDLVDGIVHMASTQTQERARRIQKKMESLWE